MVAPKCEVLVSALHKEANNVLTMPVDNASYIGENYVSLPEHIENVCDKASYVPPI
jgi:hypothetical protein